MCGEAQKPNQQGSASKQMARADAVENGKILSSAGAMAWGGGFEHPKATPVKAYSDRTPEIKPYKIGLSSVKTTGTKTRNHEIPHCADKRTRLPHNSPAPWCTNETVSCRHFVHASNRTTTIARIRAPAIGATTTAAEAATAKSSGHSCCGSDKRPVYVFTFSNTKMQRL